MRALFAALACGLNYEDLCGKAKAGKASPHIAQLWGKRIAIVSETIKGLMMNLRLFKILASNEKLQGTLIPLPLPPTFFHTHVLVYLTLAYTMLRPAPLMSYQPCK